MGNGSEDEEEINKAFIDSDEDTFIEEEEKVEKNQAKKGFFSNLTNSISLFAGGKKLTKEDLHPILEQFKLQLMSKNVA